MNSFLSKNKMNSNVIHSGILVALASVLGIGLLLCPKVLIIFLILSGCFFLIMKYPEFGLGLFVFTGVWKTAPVFLDPNAYYPTAILLIAVMFSLLIRESIRKKINFVDIDITLVSLILFNLFLLSSALFISPNQEYGLNKALRFLIFTLPIFFMIMLLKNDLERIKRLLYSIVWIGAILSMMMMYKMFVFSGILFEQLTLFGENIVIFGRAMGITLTLLIASLIYDRDIGKTQRILFTLFVPSLIIALFVSGSRGAFFAFLLTVGFILMVGFNKKKKFWKKIIYFILIAGVIMIIFELPVYQSLVERYLFQTSGSKLSKIARMTSYKKAIEIFLSKPILGIGTGGYYSGSGSFKTIGIYPHNILLEVIAETGIVGLVLFLIPLVLTILHFYKIVKSNVVTIYKKRIAVIAFVGFIYTFSVAQLSGDIQINRLVWFFIAIIWVLRSV